MINLDPRRNANKSFDLNGNGIPIVTRDTPIGNVAPHPVTLSYLQWVYDQEFAHAENIVQLREYYEGEQESMLTDRQRKYLEVGRDITFRLNAMPIPVDIMAERMRVIGFDVVDDNENEPQAGDSGFLWQVWNHNRLDATQFQVHMATARDGDSYAIVGWDDGAKQPTVHHELAFDGTEGVVVRYRPDDRKRIWYAAKRWVVDHGDDAGQKVYLTVYTDDAIANFVGSAGGRDWMPLPDENGEHIQRWVDNAGKPLGVPVFHAENKGDGTGYGRSELEDLIPLQNALDKCIIDELATADAAGFPIPWATGLNVGDNPTFAPGVMLWTESESAKFGSIAAADLSNLSEIVEKYIIRIAQVSRTPLTHFQVTGQVARADTQKAGDSPLVSKVRSRSVAIGNFWEDVMGMCRKLHNNFGGGVVYQENTISTIWDNFESIDVQEDNRKTAETAKIKAEALDILTQMYPRANQVDLAELAGYTPDEALIFAVPTTGFIDDGITQ